MQIAMQLLWYGEGGGGEGEQKSRRYVRKNKASKGLGFLLDWKSYFTPRGGMRVEELAYSWNGGWNSCFIHVY